MGQTHVGRVEWEKLRVLCTCVVAPGAMRTVDPASSNETYAGRSENRRVEVKVLVSRGVARS